MASKSKVFVSPGVYTSEKDLSFVSKSIGVTTLGIVGETLKGPAFEPMFVSNYDEFSAMFGGTVPEKFVNTQIPKYEAAYIAKSYLQESNQLFVTRVLGLSGYDAGPSWSITTQANLDCLTISATAISQPADFQFVINRSTSAVTWYNNTAGTYASSINTWSGSPMNAVFATPYTNFTGGTSTISGDMKTALSIMIANLTSLSAQTGGWYGPGSGLPTSYSNAENYFDVPDASYPASDYCDRLNDAWYYSQFTDIGSNVFTGFSFSWVINTKPGLGELISGTTSVTGSVEGTYYTYIATAHTAYNDLVVATLRSRGISNYTSTQSGVRYEVSATTAVPNVNMITSGAYSAVTTDPFATFKISGKTYDNNTFSFETSFNQSNSNYFSKVFGSTNFEKDRTEVPLFVEEEYINLLNYGYKKGYIKGLNTSLTTLPRAVNKSSTSIGFYLERYQTPVSPWVVSELRGNVVYQLFKAYTISDGDSANYDVKISIANISFNLGTFDVQIRAYNDTDANPVVLEKFVGCSMDPSQNNYVAKKIGTSDGEYEIKSKYVMLEVNYDAPSNALPCGFEGYVTRTYGNEASPFPVFKTKYDTPGDIIWNPPLTVFTDGSDDDVRSAGDNVKRTYLGISDTLGFDPEFFAYKGKQNYQGDWCTEGTYSNWSTKTKGFHMDSRATGITSVGGYNYNGPAFFAGDAEFSSEPESSSSPYYRLYSRKFTFLVQGGFDGWDIYRELRTNADTFKLGSAGYRYGQLPGCTRFPSSTGNGMFKPITVGDNSTDYANTDFYAYLLGIETYSNPELTNINVFVTPGIDIKNNEELVSSAIDMIENDRADSIYIPTMPDFDLLQNSTSMDYLIYPQGVVDDLENTGIDSNYTATYYPWVLTRDTVNNTQIYLPATAEVCRNLALTDNTAFPWFATAGYTRGIVNAIRARRRLTQEDRDTLYKGRINPIATFNDVGTVIWGNKTLQIRESALDRINVRRLLLQARKLISAVAVRLLFEQNDQVVRDQFLNAVNPILDGIRRDRGLYDFRVVVQNTPEDLDRNQLVGKIYVKPTRSLEFVDIEFLITPTGASFEDI